MRYSNSDNNISIDTVLDLSGTDRKAKSYAFLYAASKRTEKSANPVRDALDCLIPFVSPYLSTIVGEQISIEDMKKNLKGQFGFDIPFYALEQLMPALKDQGFAEWNGTARIYLSKEQKNNFSVAKEEIELHFDEIVGELERYAVEKGASQSTSEGDWGDALISFLKAEHLNTDKKFVKIKDVLLDSKKVETSIVGSFVRGLYDKKSPLFDKVLSIFMGILVEEFISTISEAGPIAQDKPVFVLYDTSVLLRLMGCSGSMLRAATEELTRYLQDLGFQIHYFAGNEAEIAGILDAIIHAKDSNQEVIGETADAISGGEISIPHLRMLQNAVPEILARMNVFPAESLEKKIMENVDFQIDERDFSGYLRRKASEYRRPYSDKNRENDSAYIGSIMRLRRRVRTNDLAACGYVFVTTNKFLSQISRRYLIEKKVIQPQHCPPVLTVGQMATIAWLLKDQNLEPEKAGRDLLANCFAAIRPDQEWFKYFRDGIQQIVGDMNAYVLDGRNLLTLTAARRIAQEESFGESAIVRKLNMAEVLSSANQLLTETLSSKDIERESAVNQERIERENAIAALQETHSQQILDSVREAGRLARMEEEARSVSRANRKAERIVGAAKCLFFALFVIMLIYGAYLSIFDQHSYSFIIVTFILLLLNILSLADLIKFQPVERLHKGLVSRISNWFV